MVSQVRLNFCETFISLPFSLLPPYGRPNRCFGPYDTAFDRFEPVSPDRILGLDATPIPLSGTVLPNAWPGSRRRTPSYERAFRLSAIRLSSISRFPSVVLQPRGSQGYTGLVTSLAL